MPTNKMTGKELFNVFIAMFVIFPLSMSFTATLVIWPYEIWHKGINAFGEAHPVWANVIATALVFLGIFAFSIQVQTKKE